MLYTYTEWLLSPNTQLLLSAMVALLIVLQRYAITWLGARLVYSLWWVVPLSILALCLPNELKPISNGAISYFLVTPQVHQQVSAWQFNTSAMYILVTLVLLAVVMWQHYRFIKTLNIQANTNQGLEHASFTSEYVSTPMVIGLWRPIVVLPCDYKTQYDSDTLQLLLEHEQTHIHRRDNLANMALLLLCIGCWFNPILWLGYQSFRRVQELACDEKVLQQKDHHQHLMYAKALINCLQNARHGALAYASYGDKNTMKQRLVHLQNLKSSSFGAKCLAVALACCSLSTVALSKSVEVEASKHDGKPRPIMRIEPKYPAEAANAGTSGYVTLQFTIDAHGYTNNIEVIDAQPHGVFEQSAIKALRQWQYTSASNTMELHTVQLDYAMSEKDVSYKQKVKHERVRVAH